MDYSPWSSKNLINRNWLKKFMQVGIDVTCMYTNFGGRSLSGFGDTVTTSKTAKFPFLTMDYSPWSLKNLIDQNQLKKFMQVGVDVTYMYTNFGGRSYFSFASRCSEIPLPSKMDKFPFPTMDYSPWSSKNLIHQNQLKKFMKVSVDVTCMYTDFGGHSYFSFGDTITFKNSQISLSDHGL